MFAQASVNDTSGYYNQTEDIFKTDPPHLTRFIVDVSAGSLAFFATLVLGVLLCWRRKHYPLRAHGALFQVTKLLGAMGVFFFVTTIVPANRAVLAFFVSHIPLAYAFPTVIRYEYTILFVDTVVDRGMCFGHWNKYDYKGNLQMPQRQLTSEWLLLPS